MSVIIAILIFIKQNREKKRHVCVCVWWPRLLDSVELSGGGGPGGQAAWSAGLLLLGHRHQVRGRRRDGQEAVRGQARLAHPQDLNK